MVREPAAQEANRPGRVPEALVRRAQEQEGQALDGQGQVDPQAVGLFQELERPPGVAGSALQVRQQGQGLGVAGHPPQGLLEETARRRLAIRPPAHVDQVVRDEVLGVAALEGRERDQEEPEPGQGRTGARPPPPARRAQEPQRPAAGEGHQGRQERQAEPGVGEVEQARRQSRQQPGHEHGPPPRPPGPAEGGQAQEQPEGQREEPGGPEARAVGPGDVLDAVLGRGEGVGQLERPQPRGLSGVSGHPVQSPPEPVGRGLALAEGLRLPPQGPGGERERHLALAVDRAPLTGGGVEGAARPGVVAEPEVDAAVRGHGGRLSRARVVGRRRRDRRGETRQEQQARGQRGPAPAAPGQGQDRGRRRQHQVRPGQGPEPDEQPGREGRGPGRRAGQQPPAGGEQGQERQQRQGDRQVDRQKPGLEEGDREVQRPEPAGGQGRPAARDPAGEGHQGPRGGDPQGGLEQQRDPDRAARDPVQERQGPGVQRGQPVRPPGLELPAPGGEERPAVVVGGVGEGLEEQGIAPPELGQEQDAQERGDPHQQDDVFAVHAAAHRTVSGQKEPPPAGAGAWCFRSGRRTA